MRQNCCRLSWVLDGWSGINNGLLEAALKTNVQRYVWIGLMNVTPLDAHNLDHTLICFLHIFPAILRSWNGKVLARAKWDTLRTRYKLSILKLIYKMFHNVSPSCMSLHVSKFQSSYNFRKNHQLVTPSFKTNIMKFSIAYKGAIIWNLLPGVLQGSIPRKFY